MLIDVLHAVTDPLTSRMPDGGPVYTETDPSRLLVEPLNAATALAFVGLVLVWVIRLRSRYGRYPILSCCLPILAVGGIGGTVYHAFRASWLFLVMDFVPIYLLGLAVTVCLWARIRPRWWHLALAGAATVLALSLGRGLPPHYGITLSYGSLAFLILVPTAVLLVRTRFRDAGLIGLALGSFGLALFFRFADAWRPPLLPMGTHWLWHLFGAATTAAMMEYLYRLRTETVGDPQPSSNSSR
jgi:hypothetical protein